jgi:low temperature requirement protein LtrA
MESFVIPSQLEPILDVLFGIGAIIIFGEIIVVLYRSVTYKFTAIQIVELLVYGFIFAVCLDWVAGFNFFKDIVAPAVWKMLGAAP